MAFSKIILNGTTLMDVTQDTVAADKLLSGISATAKNGVGVTGTIGNATIASTGSISTATIQTSPGTVSIANNETGVTGKSRIGVTPATTTGSITKYYIALKATAAANTTGTTSAITGTATASISAAGYAATTLTSSKALSANVKATTSAKDSSVYYVALPTATGTIALSNQTNDTETEISSNITTASTNSYNNNLYCNFAWAAGAITATATPTTNGYITSNDTFATTTISASSGSTNLYLKGITLTTPSTTTSQFDITVPNGNSTVTFHFKVDTSGNVWIE